MYLCLCVAFGFCEFGSPDSTLRALRLLDGFRLGNKNLVVHMCMCMHVHVRTCMRAELAIAFSHLTKTGHNCPNSSQIFSQSTFKMSGQFPK